jgi:hypothetical protein
MSAATNIVKHVVLAGCAALPIILLVSFHVTLHHGTECAESCGQWSVPDLEAIRVRIQVDSTMLRYIDDEAKDEHNDGLLSGWTMLLPSGRLAHRSQLQYYAQVFVTIGKPAIEPLAKWVMSDNLATRYIAIYSLESITQVEYGHSYFDLDATGNNRRSMLRLCLAERQQTGKVRGKPSWR